MLPLLLAGCQTAAVSDGDRQIRAAHDRVELGNLDNRLVAVLRRAASHFGKPVSVNSGYRSKAHNGRVGGAERSYHLRRKAADFSIAGVSPNTLARWAKAQPEIGGVGTYSCRKFIHIDTGPSRAWDWRCKAKRRGRS